MLSRYRPTRFRGHFDRSNFFEGWFHKIYSERHQASFVIIYGYTTGDSDDRFGFMQIHVPKQEPTILYFKREEVNCDRKKHEVRLGSNVFSLNEIHVHTEELTINLKFSGNNPLKTIKNSMGYHYFIPNLPCYHAVCNASHMVTGEVCAKSGRYFLQDETAYLEKNWGTSFPNQYVWLHAIDPLNPESSLLLSQAEIHWLGKKFLRHVGYLCLNGKQIDMRLMKRVESKFDEKNSDSQLIQFKSRDHELLISIETTQQVTFLGPEDGALRRKIVHYADAQVVMQLKQGKQTRSINLVGNYENVQGR
jgi:tocopherol cyclase